LCVLFLVYCYDDQRYLHSFPTRRSSDLCHPSPSRPVWKRMMRILLIEDEVKTADYMRQGLTESGYVVDVSNNGVNGCHLALTYRSEEHTSELQSRENLVCRLLLEKKKKT